MHRGRETRLDRLNRRAGTADGTADERRRRLHAYAAIGTVVRRKLVAAGIDPARAPALRLVDRAAAELIATGEVSPRAGPTPAADARADNDRDPPERAAALFAERIGRLAARYRDDPHTVPDIAQASLAELFAWSIVDSAST